jgi:hypothetical protein
MEKVMWQYGIFTGISQENWPFEFEQKYYSGVDEFQILQKICKMKWADDRCNSFTFPDEPFDSRGESFVESVELELERRLRLLIRPIPHDL